MTQGLIINPLYDGSVAFAPAGYKTAIAAAISFFESQFSNPITINIKFGWGEVNGSAISGAVGESEASPASYQTYSATRAALAAHATSADDAAALASLPMADPTHGANFFLPSVQQKALGLLPANGTAVDGYVGLNNADAFTFDPAHRAIAGAIDAVGVVEHEISEVMGRMEQLGSGGSNVDTVLDLFRYASPGVRDLTPAQGSFSIDGQTLLQAFNNPNNGGDAADWTPTLQGDSFGDAYFGKTGMVSAVDLRELDVLGYDSSGLTTIQALYLAVLGRAADATGLGIFTAYLAQGNTAAQVRTALAYSPEAQGDIASVLQAVLSRAATPTDIATWEQALNSGTNLADIRGALAAGSEAGADIGSRYLAVLGRAVDPGGLAAFVQYLTGGGTMAQVRPILATTPETSGNLSTSYQAELGRAADSAGLANFEGFLAGTGSLQDVRTALASSPEGQAAINAVYAAVLGRAADPGGLAAFTQYLATAGASLGSMRGILAGSGEASADIGGIYTAVLGRAADPAGLAAFVQALGAGMDLATARVTIAGGAEAAVRVSTLLQSDEGRTPTAAEVTAGQTQLGSGLSLADLNAQTLELAHNPLFVQGGAGLVSAGPNELLGYGPAAFGISTVVGFNPANDLLQLSRTQFPALAAVLHAETTTPGGVLIQADAADSILLQGVAAGALSPSNFRFT